MFGKKKKEHVESVSTPTVKNEYSCSERVCVRCGATCVRTSLGNFRCKFCGTSFTDEDAERIAAQQKAAYKAREKVTVAQNTSVQSSTVEKTPSAVQSTEAQVADEKIKVTLTSPVKANVESTSASLEASSEDIYSDNCNGVVEILTDSGRASGLIISKKGFVLTNAHAVLDPNGGISENIFVKLNGNAIRSQLIAIGNTDSNDANNVDLALLKMETVPSEAISLRLGRSANVRIGQHIYYIGNSKGEGLCMTAGIISDNSRKVGERYFIMTDAATNPGNSGGPLFNDDGVVIGIHVSARNEAVGMKYAIPVDTARLFLNAIEDQLGISHDTIADNTVPAPETSNESISAGVILTLVLSGVTLLVKNIEFIKEIVDTISG